VFFPDTVYLISEQ